MPARSLGGIYCARAIAGRVHPQCAEPQAAWAASWIVCWVASLRADTGHAATRGRSGWPNERNRKSDTRARSVLPDWLALVVRQPDREVIPIAYIGTQMGIPVRCCSRVRGRPRATTGECFGRCAPVTQTVHAMGSAPRPGMGPVAPEVARSQSSSAKYPRFSSLRRIRHPGMIRSNIRRNRSLCLRSIRWIIS